MRSIRHTRSRWAPLGTWGAWLVLAACATDPVPSEAPEPSAPELPAEARGATAEEVRAAAPMLFLRDAVAEITTYTGRRATAHTVQLGQGVFRTKDLVHLDYMRGYALADLTTWSSDEPERDERVKNIYFALGGDGVQAIFDVDTVGELDGSLAEIGSAATARVVGKLQLGGFQQETFFDMRFERVDEDTLAVQSAEPVVLSLEGFGRGQALAELAAACSVPNFTDRVEVRVQGYLDNQPGRTPPPLMRAPITVNRAGDIHRELQERVDDYDRLMRRWEENGVPQEVRDQMTREKADELMRRRADPKAAVGEVLRELAEKKGVVRANGGGTTTGDGPLVIEFPEEP